MLIVMDVETYRKDDGSIQPYCICFKMNDVVEILYGENIIFERFFEKICEYSVDDKVVIYTHNINFDGVLILNGIKNKNILFDLFIRDNNIYWIKIFYLKIQILFRCSYKIVPISVKKMGLYLNSPKQIFPYKFISESTVTYIGAVPDEKFFNSVDEHHSFCILNKILDVKKWTIEYCVQDVNIVFSVLTQILKIVDEFSFKKKIIDKTFSFSSISYKIFSNNYDSYAITNIKNTSFEHEYFKNAYYGGRCEVFGNPLNKIVHYFDFTGMYSQCMMEKFPVGKAVLKKNNLNISDVGFHTIRFKCDDYLPFLPYKKGKLIFPNGVLTGTYWFEEIQNAILYKKCEILDHFSSYVYEDQKYVFKNYVENFIDIRKKGLFYNIFGKNMNNGLYGSFGLNEDEDGDYIICHSDSEFESYQKYVDITFVKKIGVSYILQIRKNDKSRLILDKKKKWDMDCKKRNLAYAAIISSKARIKLCQYLQAVLDDGGELYYTDTDSIFAGYSENRIGVKIKDLEWMNVYQDGVFISSKFYYLKDEKLKLKGINFNPYDYDFIKKKFYSDSSSSGSVIFDEQLSITKKNFELKQAYSSKKISMFSYDKRIFNHDKTKTVPLTLSTDL